MKNSFRFFSNLSASQFETLATWINTTYTSQSLRDTFPNLSIGDLVRDSFNALTVYLLFAVYASVVSLCLVVIFSMLKPGQDSHNFSQDQLDKMTPDELEKILETSLKLWWQRGRFLLGTVLFTTLVSLISVLLLFGYYYNRFFFYPEYGDWCETNIQNWNYSVSFAILSLTSGFIFFYVLL